MPRPDFRPQNIQEAYEKAAVSALNKMGAMLRTVVSTELRTHYNIKKQDLDKYIRVVKATRGHYEISLMIANQQLPLILFDPIQTKEGVSVEEIKGKRITIKHLFIAPRKIGSLMNIGTDDVFKRRTKKRLPLIEATGPNIADLARSKRISAAIKKAYDEEFATLLSHEFSYYYSQMRQ